MKTDLDVKAVSKEILAALLDSLRKDVPAVRDYASAEADKLSRTLAQIAHLRRTRQIDKKTAAVLLDMQKHASRAVLLTIEGLGALAVEKALNAALDAVRTVANRAIGFPLL